MTAAAGHNHSEEHNAMHRKRVLAVAIPLGVIGILAAAVLKTTTTPETAGVGFPGDADPVLAAFEREFRREPGPRAKARRASIDGDVLYQTMNAVHWSTDGGARRKQRTGEDDPGEQLRE